MNALLLTLLVATPDAGPPSTVLPELRRLASNLEPAVDAPWVKAWLKAVTQLKPVKPTIAFCTEDQLRCALKEPSEPFFLPREVNDELVYARLSDPLGYARPFEVLAATGFTPKGKKVLDFGYGNLGHLLMLSKLGAQVHGVEIDALLPLAAKGLGNLVLHHGFFASDPKLVKELGKGFDLFLSKDTLTRGSVHPEGKDARAAIDLGLGDQELLALIFGMLKPGGYFYLYNLAPAQGEPYQPLADGRCPWPRQLLEKAGFEVLAYDAADSRKAREMGHLLEWDAKGADLQKTLFASYTLLRRPNPEE